MRVFNPILAGMDKMDFVMNTNGYNNNRRTGALELKFLERFEKAIISVKINECNLIICDDTPRNNYKRWRLHKKNIMHILKRHGFEINNGNLFLTEDDNGGNGSSLAQWKLRKLFLNVTENNKEAFAVLLDQDDILYHKAIKRISKKINYNSVVVSSFKIWGERERDIIGDGGIKHNSLTEFGKWINCILSMFPHKLSTIGWTKIYSRNAMYYMVNDFERFFEKNNVNIYDFFKKYNAYEDFLDFYILIRKNINLHTCSFTHIYYKHANSITARPNINAFKYDRAIMLGTLADMCVTNSEKLKSGWEKKLTCFLGVKIREIEGILKKNREIAIAGNHLMKPFMDETNDGWFVECIRNTTNNIYIRQAINNWEKSFYKNKKREYNENKNPTNPRLINWIKIYKKERKLAIENIKKRTPKERQLQKNKIHFRIGLALIIIALFLFLSPYLFTIKIDGYRIDIDVIEKVAYGKVIEIVSIFITIIATFSSVMLELRKHLEIKADEETSLRKLYFAEFNDLIRHLEANLMVTIEMKIRMENDANAVIPMSIHFENLKWPDKSILFMEKVAVIIDKSKVDDFSRLRLNLRNMNNSAEWLKNYCNTNFYTKEKMKEIIDWEIWRMMAYYVNFIYIRDHNFNFATPEQLDMYLSYPETKERLYNLFLSVRDRNNKIKMAAKYIEMYYKDRRIRRNVIFQ